MNSVQIGKDQIQRAVEFGAELFGPDSTLPIAMKHMESAAILRAIFTKLASGELALAARQEAPVEVEQND